MVTGSCGCHSSNSLGTGQAGAWGTSSPLIGLIMWLGGPGGREPWDGRIMAEQQFCLRWNNFQSNIVSSFEALLDREEFVDVTLTAEGKCLKAHRILLSACSPYFRDLFRELPSHQHPIIVLRDTCFQELKSLLNFIYHGEVNVSQERLGLLLKLAEALRIKGLAQDKKSRENNEQFGNQSVSPEKEPEEGLDRGRSGGPGSPALSLVGFPGVTGLPPGNPLVPLEPPSHKPQPPQLLHSSPPAKRRKPIHSPLAGPILLPLSTPQKEMLNSHHTPPVSNSSSHQDEELCSTPRVINLTMGNNGGPSPPPKISVVPKTELQEDVEGAQEREIGRGGSLGGSGSGIGEGSSDREDDLKEEEDMDNECHLNTTHPHDLSGLPPHLTAAVQNFVPYAAAAAAAAGSSQLDNYPGPSGVMPPASQPGWRGGPHSEPTDTSAQDSPGPLSTLQSSHMSLFFPPRTWSAATAGLRPQLPLPSLAPLTFPPSSNGSAAHAALGQAQFSPLRPRTLRPSHRPAHCPACGRYFTFGHNMKAHLKRCPKNPQRPPSCPSNTAVSTSTGEYLDCGSEYEDNITSPSMSPSSILAEKLSEVVEAASGGTVGLTGGSISLANAVKSLCPSVVCSPSALKQEQQ